MGLHEVVNPLRTVLVGFVVAASLVYLLTPIMGRLAHRTGAVDLPTDGRRMHAQAMPLLGGLGMYLGWLIAVLILVPIDRSVWGVIAGASIVVLIGIFDDLFDLEPLVKFVGQLLAIGVAMYFGICIDRIGIPFTGAILTLSPVLAYLGTAFWMAMIINMVNFIDGLDGLAAGVCGISALTFSIIALTTHFTVMGVIAAALAGTTFAFLRFNFHPASIFMGDAGSMLLGFVLACLSVESVMKGVTAIALVLPLLVLGVPFVDLFLIVWRRWRRGVPFYSPGRDHVHHDLVLVHGFSQRKSVLLLYSWCILLNGLAIAMQRGNRPIILILLFASGVATLYMARLLGSYRSRRRAIVEGEQGAPTDDPSESARGERR